MTISQMRAVRDSAYASAKRAHDENHPHICTGFMRVFTKMDLMILVREGKRK